MNQLQLITLIVTNNFIANTTEKVRDFAHELQVKHTLTLMKPSFLFHTLVKLVDAEDITIEKTAVLLPKLAT